MERREGVRKTERKGGRERESGKVERWGKDGEEVKERGSE